MKIMLRSHVLKFRATLCCITYQPRFRSVTELVKRTKTTYSVQTEDNVIKSTIFENIPENLSVFDYVTSDFEANQEKTALVSMR